MMRIRLKDTTLFFDVDGAKLVADGSKMKERPTVILLHGGPGYDHSHYKPEFQRFTSDAQLVFPDHRGQGRSDPDKRRNWSLDVWAKDVIRLCEALEIEKPIVLGSSFGGFVALALAARRPGFMSKLILVGTAASVSIERIIERFRERGGDIAAKTAANLFRNPKSPEFIAAYMEQCFPLYTVREFDPIMLERSIFRPEVLDHFFKPGGEYRRFDYHSALKRVKTPTLYLHGLLDPIVPYDLAKQTVNSFPADVVDFHLFQEAGHDVFFDKPEECSALIQDFISK